MNTKHAVDAKAVYNNYRAALRSLKSSSTSQDSRASVRKQNALKITSDRYHLPISEVKEIVRNFDAENGLNHEHPANYLLELEYEKAFESFSREQGEGPHSCNSCGAHENADIVRVRIDEILNNTSSRYAPNILSTEYYARGAETIFTLKCFTCWYHESAVKDSRVI